MACFSPSLALLAMIVSGEQPAPDQESIQGVWRVVSTQSNGMWHKCNTDRYYVFDGDTMRCGEERGKFDLHPGKAPKQIDWRTRPFPWPARPGIYSVEGDELKLCFAAEGLLGGHQSRPTELAGPPRKSRKLTAEPTLVVLTRTTLTPQSDQIGVQGVWELVRTEWNGRKNIAPRIRPPASASQNYKQATGKRSDAELWEATYFIAENGRVSIHCWGEESRNLGR